MLSLANAAAASAAFGKIFSKALNLCFILLKFELIFFVPLKLGFLFQP
jgi:hypothetical protein